MATTAVQSNTYKSGELFFFIIPIVLHEDKISTLGVCKELNIVVSNDDEEITYFNLLSNAKKRLQEIQEKKLGEDLLNQKLSPEIQEKFREFIKISNEFGRTPSIGFKMTFQELLNTNHAPSYSSKTEA